MREPTATPGIAPNGAALEGESDPCRLSDLGRQRLLAFRGEPLFYAAWDRALFLHYEIDPAELQPRVPFPLDLRDGKAYVSLVAFTMRGLRPRLGGAATAFLLSPIATHAFLNLRTYVIHDGEPGIHFLSEWVPNRLAILLGPDSFGLPYRFAEIQYTHDHESGKLRGTVDATGRGEGLLTYAATLDADRPFHASRPGSRDEFLYERYTAFTRRRKTRCLFRVWHAPWQHKPVEIEIEQSTLVDRALGESARFVQANYSPGADPVWMGRLHVLAP